jgi:hypothetical protein
MHPLPANPFGGIEIFQRQPSLVRVEKIYTRCLPVQGSMSESNQSVLPLDNGPILLLAKPCYPYSLPLVEYNNVGLPNPIDKLLQGELRLLQAN